MDLVNKIPGHILLSWLLLMTAAVAAALAESGWWAPGAMVAAVAIQAARGEYVCDGGHIERILVGVGGTLFAAIILLVNIRTGLAPEGASAFFVFTEIFILLFFRPTRFSSGLASAVVLLHVMTIAFLSPIPYAGAIVFATLTLSLAFWLNLQAVTFPESVNHPDLIVHALRRLPKTRACAEAVRRISGPVVVAAMAFWIFVLGGIFFVFTPRVGYGGKKNAAVTAEAPARGSDTSAELQVSVPRGVGMTDEAFLPMVGGIPLDETGVLRVRCTDRTGTVLTPKRSLKLRGIILDTYLRGTWIGTAPFTGVLDADDGQIDGWCRVAKIYPFYGENVWQEIRVEPELDSPMIFALPEPVEVLESSLKKDSRGAVKMNYTPGVPTTYRVKSVWSANPPEAEARAAMAEDADLIYYALPHRFERVGNFARAIAGTGGDFDKCRTIEAYLRANYTYTNTFTLHGETDPVEEFLFVKREGFCIHFAAAMAVMLRTLRIPCRVVCGYVARKGGDDFYHARKRDAHAWVEVPFAGVGWITFDPTAPLSDTSAEEEDGESIFSFFADFSEKRRQKIIRRIKNVVHDRSLSIIFSLAVLAFLASMLIVWKKRAAGIPSVSKKYKSAAGFYRRFLKIIQRHGLHKRSSQTPLEMAERAKAVLPAREVESVTDIFCRLRYGGRILSESDRQMIEECLRTLEGCKNVTSAASGRKENRDR